MTRPRSRPLARPPATRSGLPVFRSLYGEDGTLEAPLLHVEAIVSRSRRYDWEIEAHTHQGLHQVVWVRQGQVQAFLDESRVESSGPLLLVIPPGVAHAFRFSPGTEGRVLTFYAQRLVEGDAAVAALLARLFSQPRCLRLAAAGPGPTADVEQAQGTGDAAGLGDAPSPVDHVGEPGAITLADGPEECDALDARRLDQLLELLDEAASSAWPGPAVAEVGAATAMQRWLASALIARAAALLARQEREMPPDRRGHAAKGQAGDSTAAGAARSGIPTRFLALLEASYAQHWPVTRYADRLGLSVERLNRALRAETGLPAQALIHHRLVREAARRLAHVAAPVARLADELGFEDPAYFCRFFKRHTGLSPGAFRAGVAGGGRSAG